MKLNRDDFNVLVPPPPSGGGSGSGPSIRGVEPITGSEGSGDAGDGSDPKSGDPTGGETVSETVISVTPGSMISPEESEALQRQIGVPIELPGEGEDEKMSKEAARHVDKLTSNRGGIGGRGDGLLRRAIAKLNDPQIDWKSALKRFIGKALSSTEQYLGSRRHLYKGDYFYGERNKYEKLDKVAIAVDVTGSVVGDFPVFLAEVAGIVAAKNIKEVHILPFAETVHDVVVLKNPKNVKPSDFEHIRLGGGTENITAIKDYIENTLRNDIPFCVIITDGHLTTGLPNPPKARWGKNTIWLVYDNPSFARNYNFPSGWGTIINATFKK